MNGKSFGLLKDPIGDISKRFYQIIIDSKSENVFNFINIKLNLRNEIDTIILLKNNIDFSLGEIYI